MLVISNEDVHQVLSMNDCIEALDGIVYDQARGHRKRVQQ